MLAITLQHTHAECWIVAQIDPLKHSKAVQFMRQAAVPFWAPGYPTVRIRRGRRMEERVPMLKGYVLIPSSYFDSAGVTMAPGFHSFMLANDYLAMIRDQDLEPLREMEKMLNDPGRMVGPAKHKWRAGAVARMIDDIWNQIGLRVCRVDSRGMVTADVNDGVYRMTIHESRLVPSES